MATEERSLDDYARDAAEFLRQSGAIQRGDIQIAAEKCVTVEAIEEAIDLPPVIKWVRVKNRMLELDIAVACKPYLGHFIVEGEGAMVIARNLNAEHKAKLLQGHAMGLRDTLVSVCQDGRDVEAVDHHLRGLGMNLPALVGAVKAAGLPLPKRLDKELKKLTAASS